MVQASKLPAQLCAMLVSCALPVDAASRDGAAVVGVLIRCASTSWQPRYICRHIGCLLCHSIRYLLI